MKHRRIIWGLWPLALLAACSEKPQTIGFSNSGPDTAAFKGAENPFVEPGWKPGDRTSWEQHLKTRAQMGQNEYNRIN